MTPNRGCLIGDIGEKAPSSFSTRPWPPGGLASANTGTFAHGASSLALGQSWPFAQCGRGSGPLGTGPFYAQTQPDKLTVR